MYSKNVKTKNQNSIANRYLFITICPLVLLVILVLITAVTQASRIMYKQKSEDLSHVSNLIKQIYDDAYPGDYVLKSEETTLGTSYTLYKGESLLSGDYSLLDQMKIDLDMDLSLVYYDTRILTTLYTEEQVRAIGTGINSRILDSLNGDAKELFFDNVDIYGAKYLVLYSPIQNQDGEMIGMLELCKARKQIDYDIYKSMFPICSLTIIGMLILGYISLKASSGLLKRIDFFEKFLNQVSNGNLSAQLDVLVLQEKDELAQAGKAAVAMQYSLKRLIDYDALTQIYNRRYGRKYYHKIYENAIDSGMDFSVCIGDIDFFKKVNDTYGHECGDIVLIEVAKILKEGMIGHGMAARWGGEEFLLIFDKENGLIAKGILEGILDQIRAQVFHYEDKEFQITMTFGVTEGVTSITEEDLLKIADDKLYHGKENGRNRIVYEEDTLVDSE